MLQSSDSEKSRPLTQAELNAIFRSRGPGMTCRGGQFARLTGGNLNGLTLANRDLKEADLSGTSMVGANLYGSNLLRATLYCADLRSSDFRNANLAGADMRGASFRGANLSFATLDYADLRAGRMMYLSSTGASIVDRGDLSTVKGNAEQGVDFSHCRMKQVSFGNAKLDNVKFDGAILAGAKFGGAQLGNASFKGAVLTGVNLKELRVPPEALAECVLDVSEAALSRSTVLKEKLEAHQSWIASNGRQGAAAVLDGEDLRPLSKEFSHKKLTGLSARNCIALGVDFSGSELQAAKFDGADLRASNFTQTDLSGVSLAGAKLDHANFDRAKLLSLQLLNGAVIRPNLIGAEATLLQFSTVTSDECLSALGLAPSV